MCYRTVMQVEPEKTVRNYNEFYGATLPNFRRAGAFDVAAGSHLDIHHPAIQAGITLVNDKIDEILGENNYLTQENLFLPNIRIVDPTPSDPNLLGWYSPSACEIVIVDHNRNKDPVERTKTFIHEYLHFLSHNGRDGTEIITEQSPLDTKNNIGFKRSTGLDIREGKEGEITGDYFVAFNEAVTEQLAIDILPDACATYEDCRGLLNQVIDDAVTRKLGSKNENGIFQPWSREQFKNHIYRCYFQGDLERFTRLLQTVYEEYDISEQQFGLMTHRTDLPSVIKKITPFDPSTPPTPALIEMLVQERLNAKTPEDYITDVDPEPRPNNDKRENIHGTNYDTFIREHGIAPDSKMIVGNKEYDIDTMGLIIYPQEYSTMILQDIREELDTLVARYQEHHDIEVTDITERIDFLLFKRSQMSMLSHGFRDFYIYKHTLIDKL